MHNELAYKILYIIALLVRTSGGARSLTYRTSILYSNVYYYQGEARSNIVHDIYPSTLI